MEGDKKCIGDDSAWSWEQNKLMSEEEGGGSSSSSSGCEGRGENRPTGNLEITTMLSGKGREKEGKILADKEGKKENKEGAKELMNDVSVYE